MNGTITNSAMLVGLYVSQWTARKLDKSAGKKVSEDFGNQEQAARVHKTLIAEQAIKKISTVVNETRTFFYDNTLPWTDDGKRILPAANFMETTQKIRELEGKFWQAVTELEDNYPALIQEAKIILNGLFRQEDYPKIEDIRKRYAFAVTVDPIPDANDFRVHLQDDQIRVIRQQIEDRLQDATATAMKDLWSRLHGAVSNMAERLSDPKNIFRDSLVGNLEDLVDLLPRLNVTGDPELERLRAEVEAKLIKDPETLRKDVDERKQTHRDAEAILSAMAAYMGS